MGNLGIPSRLKSDQNICLLISKENVDCAKSIISTLTKTLKNQFKVIVVLEVILNIKKIKIELVFNNNCGKYKTCM